MSVIDHDGKYIPLFSLWAQRKIVLVFTPHMDSRCCKDQVSQLTKIQPDLLRQGVSVGVVTAGKHEDIGRFRAEHSFHGEVYVDSNSLGPECYKRLTHANGLEYMFARNNSKHPPLVPNIEKIDPDSDNTSPSTRDTETSQCGGVFVLGPGNICDYSLVGDLVDFDKVKAVATGKNAHDGEIFYRRTLDWTSKQFHDDKTINAVVSDLPVRTVVCECPFKTTNVSVGFIAAVVIVVAIGLQYNIGPEDSFNVEHTLIFTGHCLLVLIACVVGRDKILHTQLWSHFKADRSMNIATDRKYCPLSKFYTETRNRYIVADQPTIGGYPLYNISAIERIVESAASDLHTNNKDAAALSATQSTLCYVKEFLANPNPYLGRSGPTCPFVPKSLQLDSIYLSVVPRVSFAQGLDFLLLEAMEMFKTLEPTSGLKASYKAIILIFPDLLQADIPTMIDATQKRLKPKFVEEGLMLGEFHAHNNATGLHNNHFYPLRTGYPCFAIRFMVPSDIVFLNPIEFPPSTRVKMLTSFINKFSDHTSNYAQIEIARKLLKELEAKNSG